MSFSHDKDVIDHMAENRSDNYKTMSQRLSCYGITYTIPTIYIYIYKNVGYHNM